MHGVDDASLTPLNLKLIRPGARHGVTPHLTSKILFALGLPVHPNPGLPLRSPSRVCSWQPRMAPKHVFQSSAAHSPRQILSSLGLQSTYFQAFTQVPLRVLNASFRVAQHTHPVRYCPLWASQSTHFRAFTQVSLKVLIASY
jgi:hypothetical protein